MSTIPSDLPGPVAEPTGPVAGAVIEPPIDNAPASGVDTSPPASADSLVGAPEIHSPAPVAASGEVILSVQDPWYIQNFDPSLAGCPSIARTGTSVSSALADQVISIGATNGVTITKR